jgi:hypothetical protein
MVRPLSPDDHLVGLGEVDGLIGVGAGDVGHPHQRLRRGAAGPGGLLILAPVATPAVALVAGARVSRGRVRRACRGRGAVLLGGQTLEAGAGSEEGRRILVSNMLRL